MCIDMEYKSSPSWAVPRIRFMIAALVVGATASIAIAWACAIWSPIRTIVDPFPHPTGIADAVDPDGAVGLHYRESGFGWSYMWQRGWRSLTNGEEDVFWSGPYGGIYHRVAGWPLPALRSRVEVLDSQASGRFSEGEPEPMVLPQRQRWDLPAGEIVYRGIATKDLPDRLRAFQDRRLPLVPIGVGFAVDTLAYAMAFALLVSGDRALRRRPRPAPRGFAVLTKGAE
jgi:hypothetical protein